MIEIGHQIQNFFSVQPDTFDWTLGKTVHLWKFQVKPAIFSQLSDSEKIIGERFRFDADRNRYVTGRRSLRFLLSKYLSVHPMDICINAEKGQKPFVNNPDSTIRFNISHSGEWVVVALAHEELGIDIEKIDPVFDFENLLQEHFSLAEQQFVYVAEIPVAAFYFLWTRKEALIKAVGKGLGENLKILSVLGQVSPLELNKDNWKIESFILASNYPASLAYCSLSEEIIYLDGSYLNTGI